MILACQNISKSFGVDAVLRNVSFHVEDQEKVAIVGINGAGKSTLLKIITQELSPDEGSVTIARGKTLGYLAQHQEIVSERTIYEEVLEGKRSLIDMETRIRQMEDGMQDVAGKQMESYLEEYHRLLHEFEARDGYAYRSEVSGVLKGLGFSEDEFTKRCGELSGGQKTRVSLARLLVTHPDLILLDEPTNHLDIESISWLETFLLNYKGAVVIVAHDRYFLDRIVTKVVEISMHKSSVYEGNYTAYAEKAAKAREDALKAYYNQQREIKHQEEVIEKLKSFNREKSIKRAESREKQLQKIEVLEKPQEENSKMHITLTPSVISGNDVLTVEHLAKAYGEKQLFSDISFEIKRGERVALIGANGTGKTTILKILNQKIEADAGSIHLGTNVHLGYYDQEQQVLHMEKTLIDEIADDYPKLTHTKIRNVLAAFLFTDEDVFKRVSDLSGGERGRLSLAKLMLSEANFLILDEPTNHLDITSKEILESALNSYEGTVFFVSHDRYFINKTATRILNLTERSIINYIGNYDYYLEKKETNEQAYLNPKTTVSVVESEISGEGKADWQSQKEEQAKLRKLRNQIRKIEEEIDTLETRLAEIDEAFSSAEVATNSAKLNELHGEQVKIQERLEILYEDWEKLSDD
jgi:ATP-binding cassette subfamily F protein 3